MSKLISDLIHEFHSLDEIEDDFEFFIMNIVIDENGDVESSDAIEAITKIEIDETNQECLFYSDPEGNAKFIGEAIKEISSVSSEYQLCSAVENTIEDSFIRIDNPIIGFGENIEQRRFFVVCQAFENNPVLH